MKRTYIVSLLLLPLTLAASVSTASERDPHVGARNKLMDATVEIILEAGRNLYWSCNPQFQKRLFMVYEQWIPYPPPIGKRGDSSFWYAYFNDLAGEYSTYDCFDSAIVLKEAALEAGTHENEEELENTRYYVEALKRDKREGYLSPGNPKHPRYNDESYDPYDNYPPYEDEDGEGLYD